MIEGKCCAITKLQKSISIIIICFWQDTNITSNQQAYFSTEESGYCITHQEGRKNPRRRDCEPTSPRDCRRITEETISLNVGMRFKNVFFA